MNGTQLKLNRVKPARVRIFYEVETEGSEKKIELPFVVGVLSDLSGDNVAQSTVENTFADVDFDSLDSFLNSCKPFISYTVKNVITNDGNIKVDLKFQSQSDFEIKNVIAQIEPVNELHQTIKAMRHVSVLIDGNDKAIEFLDQLLSDKSSIDSMIDELTKKLEENTENSVE